MIGGLLVGLGRWLIGSQGGQIVLVVTVVLIALAGWTWKVARDARISVMERVLKETAEESSRRLRELNAVAAQSAAREAALAQAEAQRAKLIGEIHALSQANNDRVCLPHSSVLRLDSLRGRPARRGARKPARPSPQLTQSCMQPVAIRPDLKGGQLSAGQTERLWSEDRSSLDACRERHRTLVWFIAERDAALAGATNKGRGSHE